MLENNTSLFNKSFGLNVHIPTRTLRQVKETAEKTVSSLWTPVVDYFDKSTPVFTGDVQKEIEKSYLRIYSLGATMREGRDIPTFNMKV